MPEEQQISYITSNSSKFEEACHVLSPLEFMQKTGYSLSRKSLDLEEIQGRAIDIARHKTAQAFEMNNGLPVIVDDISFHIDALNGFPGPYIKWLLEALQDDGIWKLVSPYADHSCKAVCWIGFMRNREEGPLLFTGEIHGTLVSPRGSTRHGKLSWNSLLQPIGMNTTFGELTIEEISRFSPRREALLNLQQYLIQKRESKTTSKEIKT